MNQWSEWVSAAVERYKRGERDTFWKDDSYPTQVPDNKKQPSDDARWKQYKEWLKRRGK